MDEPWKKVGRAKCLTKQSEEKHDRKENLSEKKKKGKSKGHVESSNGGGEEK